MDAVSDRDFILDFIFAATKTMTHLSRLCEDIVIWSSEEFGFIRLSDAYSSGSSMMPQKRNPDYAELIRGKSGRVFGSLVAVLTTLKGLPLTYNGDLQEDKPPMMDAADTVAASLAAATGMVREMSVNRDRMEAASQGQEILATDYADHLVREHDLPFREAYVKVAAPHPRRTNRRHRSPQHNRRGIPSRPRHPRWHRPEPHPRSHHARVRRARIGKIEWRVVVLPTPYNAASSQRNPALSRGSRGSCRDARTRDRNSHATSPPP